MPQEKNWDGSVAFFIMGFDLELRVELIVKKDCYCYTSLYIAPFFIPFECPPTLF